MPNVATHQTIEPARIEVSYIGEQKNRPFKLPNERFLLTAHRMVENYIGEPRPLSKLTATYTNVVATEPLQAIDRYPIILVISIVDGNNALITGIRNDDRYIWGITDWPATVVVVYVGGIEQTVFDAIIRQSRVLASRDDLSPEKVDKQVGPLEHKWDPKFRSGLAPDVKQMLFPYRVLSF